MNLPDWLDDVIVTLIGSSAVTGGIGWIFRTRRIDRLAAEKKQTDNETALKREHAAELAACETRWLAQTTASEARYLATVTLYEAKLEKVQAKADSMFNDMLMRERDYNKALMSGTDTFQKVIEMSAVNATALKEALATITEAKSIIAEAKAFIITQRKADGTP